MRKHAFTIIELLVVVAIIALLVAILMPAMSRAIEGARRSVCASRQHQIFLSVAGYAVDNGGKFPSTNYPGDLWGTNGDHNHTTWINPKSYNVIVAGINPLTVAGDDAVAGELQLYCPNLQNDWRWTTSGMVRIGYHLLFGHYGTTYPGGEPWKSVTSMTDASASKFMSADMIEEYTWSPSISSGTHGPVGRVTWNPGTFPDEAGVEGGNVAYLDGGVVWRAMAEMMRYSVARATPRVWGWW
ncbi:MAG: prepilin-type N-terminal cleavage/methylation domain-containing protein [Planctomycetes bacterium]|nr:prepilin-type N-terminal cleavage/methylation domain-containing protein [Planctomycetota bacterium]